MARPVRVSQEQHFTLPVGALWDLLGNTEHVNRMLGLPAVDFAAATDDVQGFYRPASARMLGVRLTWREYPFEWVRHRRYAVLRLYERGPVERFWGGIELFPAEGGTRVRAFAEVTPKRGWPLAGIPVRILARQNVNQLLAYCRRHVQGWQAQPEQPFPRGRPRGVHAATLQRLHRRLEAQPAADAIVAERLAALLAEGSDEEVLHMRPYALARRWGLPRDSVLHTFLAATVVGLLELAWELMCPNCRVPKAGFRSFGSIGEQFHCDLCGTDYAADLDRTTELRFSVHPTVRRAEDAIYCIGGPVNTPHILVQQGLPPGAAHGLEAELPDEPLRVRVLRLNHTVTLEPAPDGPEALRLDYTDDGWDASALRFRPGPVRVDWHNHAAAPQVAVIERLEWDPDAVTAARVMALPEFRTLFSSEVLQPGREIGVRNLCVLFTDLKDSTALYEAVGDAPAYGRVHRHFDFLVECCAHHEGGIVKTIGDAVMASFPSAEDALRAALEMQTRVDAFNAQLGVPEPIVIKVGLHHGPAIAVNANGQMDYFGRTVNIAARIQGLSAGGDVVLSAALYGEPGIQAVLAGVPCSAERFRAPLKGIAGESELVRLRPAPGQAPPRPLRARLFHP